MRSLSPAVKASLVTLALIGTPFDAGAFGTQDDQPKDATRAAFDRLDRNRDGRLSRDEAGNDVDIAGRFGDADSNHDGALVVEEYARFKSAEQKAHLEEFLDDSTITAKIKAELLKDIGVKGLTISVETHRGHVILSGFVDHEQQIRRAMEIASGVRGVLSVKNSLVLKG